MNWTPEYRLRLIAALTARNIDSWLCKTDSSWPTLMERIAFLADMPDEFLEGNKGNFEDAIRWIEMEGE